MAEGEGFLGRWSRRKQLAKEGVPLEEPALPTLQAEERQDLAGGAAASGAAAPVVPAKREDGQAAAAPQQEPARPLPTLEDVRTLTPQSDFTPFVARGVAPEVKNAAMKKLFADPHFNVMDKLDIYVDDYSQPDPLPAAMVRQLASAKFLKLFEEEEEDKEKKEHGEKDKAGDDANTPTPPDVAQSALCNDFPSQPQAQPDPPVPVASQSPDADPDLRLQQDHAAGRPDPGRGAA